MSVSVCVSVHAEQPGTAHWATNEADTQFSAITLRRVMIHYLGVQGRTDFFDSIPGHPVQVNH